MKKIISLAILSLSLFLVFSFITPVLAATQWEGCDDPTKPCLQNPLSVNTPQELIGQLIDAVLGVVGSIALLMFVYGGITWMTSAGSPEKVKKGREIIVWSTIGLVIIFSAYGLVRVVIEGVK